VVGKWQCDGRERIKVVATRRRNARVVRTMEAWSWRIGKVGVVLSKGK